MARAWPPTCCGVASVAPASALGTLLTGKLCTSERPPHLEPVGMEAAVERFRLKRADVLVASDRKTSSSPRAQSQVVPAGTSHPRFSCRLLKSTTPVLQCSHARSASTVVTRPWWAASHDRRRATRVVILHVKWGPQGQMGHTVSHRYAAGCYACRGAVEHAAGPIPEAGSCALNISGRA